MVSVVICTHERPHLLRPALESCIAHASSGEVPYEIVVVDNSRTPYAEALVRDLALPVPVRAIEAGPPNISVARNAGVRAAAGDLIAFLDDDQLVRPGWLDALVQTLRNSGADAVLGAVTPRYQEEAAPDRDWGLFSRGLDRPSGTVIGVEGPTQPPRFAFGTGNSLWRRATTLATDQPFSPEFGASGGEDYDLYLRRYRAGCRFAWCAEAEVIECVPPGRMGLTHQALRAFSGAQAYAAARVRNSPRPLVSASALMARGAAQVALHTAGAPAVYLLSRLKRTRVGGGRRGARGLAVGEGRFTDLVLSQIAFGLGKVVWWRKFPLYRMGWDKAPAGAGPMPLPAIQATGP